MILFAIIVLVALSALVGQVYLYSYGLGIVANAILITLMMMISDDERL